MRDRNLYHSSNYNKHISDNPLQRYLIGRFHGKVAGILQRVAPYSVLDAGCGEGFVARYVQSQSDLRIFGIDIDAEALRMALRLNEDLPVICGSVSNMPFSDNTFDLVLCTEVLEHLGSPEIGLKELCRVSRRWLVLSVPHEPFFCLANFLRGKNLRSWGNDPGHVNHWTMPAFRRFLEQECVILDLDTSFPWIIAFCRKRV